MSIQLRIIVVLVLLILAAYSFKAESAQQLYKCQQADGTYLYTVEKCDTGGGCVVGGEAYPQDHETCLANAEKLEEMSKVEQERKLKAAYETLEKTLDTYQEEKPEEVTTESDYVVKTETVRQCPYIDYVNVRTDCQGFCLVYRGAFDRLGMQRGKIKRETGFPSSLGITVNHRKLGFIGDAAYTSNGNQYFEFTVWPSSTIYPPPVDRDLSYQLTCAYFS